LYYYGINLVDVIEGRGPHPVVVYLCAQRLPDDSMTAALLQGGREYFGWGTDRHMAAALFDAVNVNTKATGHWKKGKAPDFPEWPRPGKTKANKAKPQTSLAELHAALSRR
jgi:hypothetical protein